MTKDAANVANIIKNINALINNATNWLYYLGNFKHMAHSLTPYKVGLQ